MQPTQRQRSVNPRLGTYVGIFTSAFAALVLVVMILEQLGVSGMPLRAAMLLGPLALFALIGVAARTSEPLDYLAAGRRVPAFYNGLLQGVTAIGGTGIVALTGLFFLHGFDTWSIAGGIIAGFVVFGVLVAPFLRKFGGFTVPTYIGRRFDSRGLRILAAALLSLPMLLVLAAELQVAVRAAQWLTGFSPALLLVLLAASLGLTVGFGGVRSLTWAGTAQAIAALLALVVPASLVAVLAGNLPVPQLSHGPTLRAIGRLETILGVPIPILSPLSFDLAGTGLSPILQRFATPFGALGPASYVLTSFVVLAGIAAAPWLIMRTGTTPSVYESRKSQGWATVMGGLVLLTIAAIAVFLRDYVMDTLVGRSSTGLPEWFRSLAASGHAAVDGFSSRLPLSSFSFRRDSALFALPFAAGFPGVSLYLLLVGAIAAAMAGAGAVAVTLGTTIAEDVVSGTRWDPPAAAARVWTARLATLAVVVGGAALTMFVPADPFALFLWSLALLAATAFPVLALSIWWKRLNAVGAAASMLAGFTITTIAILTGEAGLHPFKSILAGAVGMPVAIAVALFVTNVFGQPSKAALELVLEMRIPGGETIVDREARLHRLKERHASVKT